MSLSESCAKALSDKTYEKRKLAAVEIEKYEKISQQFIAKNNNNFIFIEWLWNSTRTKTLHK